MVAFSGGLDSTLLLHACQRYSPASLLSLKAVHIHHGLSHNADHWAQHCLEQCRNLDIELIVEKVSVLSAGNGIEASARTERYRVFEKYLPPRGMLLQGHHLDDQAETIIYRMILGHGVRGLGGIPAIRTLAEGEIRRPFMSFNRRELEVVARHWQLSWIEDESNSDAEFSRNYIRHNIFPQIVTRWPKAAERIANSGHWCREAADMLADLAEIDLAACRVQKDGREDDIRLSISGLRRLSTPRQFNLLRYWLQCANIDLNESKTRSLVDFIFGRSSEGLFQLNANKRVGIHRGSVCLVTIVDVADYDLVWEFPNKLQTPSGLLYADLLTQSDVGGGMLKPPLESQRVVVRNRRGGEKFHPEGRQGGCTLKKWLNEQRIPEWERKSIPLVFYDDVLVAVGDLVLDKNFASKKDGYKIMWRR
ncbi:tRNA lysidine(34) synthetase TilS [Hahella ganghwensis]|uniref:tRNA lysidine(34) synthetase TilS n=1 Tax=Hahella ganghwensis TaxID=286420 RepID=UPI00036177D1|nr:tRNA lysidine(34) synthetase TilS [Hahella ganghwensis]